MWHQTTMTYVVLWVIGQADRSFQPFGVGNMKGHPKYDNNYKLDRCNSIAGITYKQDTSLGYTDPHTAAVTWGMMSFGATFSLLLFESTLCLLILAHIHKVNPQTYWKMTCYRHFNGPLGCPCKFPFKWGRWSKSFLRSHKNMSLFLGNKHFYYVNIGQLTDIFVCINNIDPKSLENRAFV